LIAGSQSDMILNVLQAQNIQEQNIGEILAYSHIYESEPWGFNDPNYSKHFNFTLPYSQNNPE